MKFNYLPLLIITGLTYLSAGCGSTKDTRASRSLQNLTAKYNIKYNARIMLDESRRDLEAVYVDDYGQVLPIFKEPTEASAQSLAANLDSVILKANTIVNEKTYSKFVDDAYLLIGEANYYKARFFNAAEFFAYVYNTYPDRKVIQQKALVWQARSLLQLQNVEEASKNIDSALKYVNYSKKTKRISAEVYATAAQYAINIGKEEAAIDLLQKAIKSKTSKQNKIRWRYILGQIQEITGQPESAYANYTRVVKSNAPFEMAFNAGLNRIRIEDKLAGRNVDRIARLHSLLKNDKNKDFIDQIYYRIADIHLEKQEVDEAIKNYNLAVRNSTKNQNQKGLSYLKIADIYFKEGDYVSAKAYYDSTVSAMSPSYPGYDIIKRKGGNLELLANRYRVIGREDTLQMLARMPEAEREVRIGALVREQMERVQNLSLNNESPGTMTAAIDNPNQGQAEGKFYFNNTTAIRQGLIDFKRRWGSRPLEDNWRRSGRSAAETILNQVDNPDAPVGSQINANAAVITPEVLTNGYVSNLPLTEASVQLSNQKIADSYYDIASFYRDDLKDTREAIKTFEELLRRVPDANNKLAVYYNLYQLYSNVNASKSDEYKSLLLSKYPESPFAKVILDPDYGSKSNEKEIALNKAYNQIYDLYAQKKHAEVIKQIAAFDQQFGKTALSSQIAYLNALATGHLQKLPEFENALQQVVSTYPDDKLITPLVQQHLQYISNNRTLFITRTTALMEYNPFEPVFVEPAPQTVAVVQKAPEGNQGVSNPKNNKSQAPEASNTGKKETPGMSAADKKPGTQTTSPAQSSVKPKPLYYMPDSAEYYFIVNVMDPGTNLNSSRFGVGQFNRSRFAGVPIKHQLKEVNNENQLVLVGPFSNLSSVKDYERSIVPLIREIMKIPAEKYNTFVITKDELDKIKNSTQINAYLDFYKNVQ